MNVYAQFGFTQVYNFREENVSYTLGSFIKTFP